MKIGADIGLLTAVLAAIVPVCAQAGFYERAGEGWFWYEDPPPILEASSPEIPQEGPAQVAIEAPVGQAAERQGPPPLSAAWLKTALPEYRMRAIDEPSQENVRAYLYLQRVTLDKSTEFARMVKTVTIGDPYLDEIARQPSANYATHTLSRSRAGNTNEVLGQVARQVGLFFFFASDCDLCDAQAEVLEILERNHGFTVKAISLDGRPLKGGRYSGYATDRGQARRLGVVRTPALYMVRPPGTTLPIGQGAMAADDIEQRILIKTMEQGWISREAFQRTRHYDEGLQILPESPAFEEMISDPTRLVEYLRAQAARP